MSIRTQIRQSLVEIALREAAQWPTLLKNHFSPQLKIIGQLNSRKGTRKTEKGASKREDGKGRTRNTEKEKKGKGKKEKGT